MKHKFLATVAALGLSLTASAAMALPIITGGISFAGDAAPAPAGNWGGATGVDFGTAPNARVSSVSGSYAGVPAGSANGQLATFYDFTFNGGLNPNPHLLWTFDYNGVTYSFTMDQVDIKDQDTNFLELTGYGTLSITNFEDARGVWRFTGQQAGTPATFSFSSSNEPIGVPEPGSIALLGMGLMGLGLARRRK